MGGAEGGAVLGMHKCHQLTIVRFHHGAVPLDQHSYVLKESIDAHSKHSFLQLIYTPGRTAVDTHSAVTTLHSVLLMSAHCRDAPLSQAACSLFTVADPTVDT